MRQKPFSFGVLFSGKCARIHFFFCFALCTLPISGTQGREIDIEEYRDLLQTWAERLKTPSLELGDSAFLEVLAAASSDLEDLVVTSEDFSMEVDNRWLMNLSRRAKQDPLNAATHAKAARARLEAIGEAIPSGVYMVPPEKAQEILKGVLSSSEFRSASPPNWFSRAINRFFRKIGEGIEWFFEKVLDGLSKWLPGFEWMKGHEAWDRGGTLSTFLIVFAALLALVLLFFIAAKAIRKRRERRERTSEEEREYEKLPDPDHLTRMRDSALGDGDWRGAIRYSYLILLSRLQSLGLLRYDRCKTNWEYAEELKSEGPILPHFQRLTHRFDESWYGSCMTTPRHYEEFKQGLQSIFGENRETE